MLGSQLSSGRKLIAAALCGLFALAGCGEHMAFPVSESAQERLPGNVNVIRVTTKNIAHVRQVYYEPPVSHAANPPYDPGRYAYRVGPGDQLRIQVWTTPERAPTGSDAALRPAEGPVIDETGHFFYPFVGEVRAQGRTVSDIRNELTERLRAYITDPQVEVAVQQFRAHSVMITGAVGGAGPTTLTNVPLRLIELINSAGAGEDADLSRVEVRRRGQTFTVNVRAFLEMGDYRQNPVMLPGDVVFVPELRNNKVFVFGEIATTEVQLDPGGKSLTELLAELGGIDRMRANAKGVFVFRRTKVTTSGFDVFQFDLSDASALVLLSDFPLSPLDIVFVTKDPVTQWTDTVGRVLIPVYGFLEVRSVAESL